MEKAFIFDMDGTLFDTENLIMEGLRDISKKHGERTDLDAFYPTTCGCTLPDAKVLYEAFFGKGYPARYCRLNGGICA
jgi:beta-phosphoglucomutase-like phosphatase (HAD superfamily)